MLNKNITGYGSHAYVVFREYYDRYIEFLDKFKFADAFQFTNDGILEKKRFYMPTKNLFIQYCNKRSMNGHRGYIWRMCGRTLSNREIFSMGYIPIEKVLGEGECPKEPCEEVNQQTYVQRMFWFG